MRCLALQVGGLSISTTTSASVFAFSMGAISDIPAVRTFCIFAALSTLGIYLMMNTFYLGCAVYAERRIRAGLPDFVATCCLCCMPRRCVFPH